MRFTNQRPDNPPMECRGVFISINKNLTDSFAGIQFDKFRFIKAKLHVFGDMLAYLSRLVPAEHIEDYSYLCSQRSDAGLLLLTPGAVLQQRKPSRLAMKPLSVIDFSCFRIADMTTAGWRRGNYKMASSVPYSLMAVSKSFAPPVSPNSFRSRRTRVLVTAWGVAMVRLAISEGRK